MYNISKRAVPPRLFRLCVFFALLPVFAGGFFYAQDNVPPEGAAADTTSAEIREEDILIPQGEIPEPGGDTSSEASPSGSLLKLVIILVLVCVGCYFILRFLKKSSAGSTDDPFLKNVASIPLAPGKSVSVVTLGDQAFLIGVSDHSVSLISEIKDAELVDRMNLNAGLAAENRKSFQEILSSFFPKAGRRDDFSSSTTAAADFLRKSRERIRTGGGVSSYGENPENPSGKNGGAE